LDQTGTVRTLPAAAERTAAAATNVTPTAKSSTGLFEAPAWSKTNKDKDSIDFSLDDLDASVPARDANSTGVMKSIRLDDNTKVDLGEPLRESNSGPRKATVAKSVYDVEMIDDTGELASLTTAFPELEAELNARIGEDSMDEVRESLDTRLTQALEGLDVDADLIGETRIDTQLTRSTTANMENSIDIDFDEVDLVGATQTMQVNSGDLDLDLPGLLDDNNVGLDFESIASAGDEDFSKTKVFNEEIFTPDMLEASDLSDTFSTEAISDADETRVAEVLIDEDGLRPEDFGVSTEELSKDRNDYSYLEDDASIVTESLNIDFDELEELGLDDDNIIPFDPSKKKRSA